MDDICLLAIVCFLSVLVSSAICTYVLFVKYGDRYKCIEKDIDSVKDQQRKNAIEISEVKDQLQYTQAKLVNDVTRQISVNASGRDIINGGNSNG